MRGHRQKLTYSEKPMGTNTKTAVTSIVGARPVRAAQFHLLIVDSDL